jgi:23S rRNA (guanine745-N1)-methyltransferase
MPAACDERDEPERALPPAETAAPADAAAPADTAAPAVILGQDGAARRPPRTPPPGVVTLVCPVRGCGAPLARVEGGPGRGLVCPRGHRFDLARSGYCNLLQPQDRRSRRPGDSAAALAARRRLFDRGLGDWLVPHLLAAFDELRLPAGAAVLDVGCGEGFYLGTLARERDVEAHGLDISAAAIDLAARRYPQASWVVANADRSLPYAAGGFDLALSLTSRLHPPELRRVLRPPGPAALAPAAATGAPGTPVDGGGVLLIGVPAADDLVELRAAVLGEGRLRDRLQPAVTALAADFELVRQTTARARLHLDAAAAQDLLASTYRAGRERERRRAAGLAGLDVTASRDLAIFQPHSPPPPA